jgi:uncharacterized protein (DUF1697 family)
MATGREADLHVALMRGINVGGKNRLPMKNLVAIFEDAGCRDVRTWIQSGNVLFRAGKGLAARVPKLVTDAVEARLGLRVPVVVRTAAELRKAAVANPYRKAGVDPRELHVVFLAKKPTAKQVGALDPDRSPGDEFVVRGSEIHIRAPRGVARTKLTNDWFDRQLDTVSTMRNWNTVSKLLELAER